MGQQISQVFRKVATNPATKNSVPRMVSGLKRAQIGLQQQAARYTSWASRVGSVGFREGVEAYVEAGVDTSLTYVADGHRVSGQGLVQAWGVPALSNVLSPLGSRKVNAKLQDLGWGAASGVSRKIQEHGVNAAGHFVNGVVSYSGAPMTYLPQYESYRGDGYDGPGWDVRDALIGGIKQTVSSSVSSSGPVESLKSVSFDPSAGEVLLSAASHGGAGSGAVLVDELVEVPGE